MRVYTKLKKKQQNKKPGGEAQVLQHLPSKHKALKN
jgi:hypothetical protein